MPIIKYDNNNENNYSFDSDKIEFVTGIEKLKSIVIPGTAYAYWKMDDNEEDEVFRDSTPNSRDLRFANYTSVNKVLAKINNGLQGINKDTGFCRFGVESNDFSFERTDEFSIEGWIKFTGTSYLQDLVTKLKNLTPFSGYGLNIQNNKLRFVIRDNLGNVIAVETASIYNDGLFHHFVARYNGNSSNTGMQIIVDNILDTVISAAGTLTGTIINNDVSFQISGRDGSNNCLDVSTIIDEVVIYNRELTDAEIAFRWNLGNGTQTLPGAETSYSTNNPTSIAKAGIQATSILDFDSVTNELGDDSIEWIAVVNGIGKYWDGLLWVDSTGYPQSNITAVIKANISLLELIGLSSINVKSVFHSEDGSTTPELDSYTIEFDIEPDDPLLTETIISGTYLDIGNNKPITEITIRPVSYLYGANTIITNINIEVDYDNITGIFQARIYVEDIEPDELIWNFGTKEIRTKYLTGNLKFSDLQRIYI